MQFTQSAKVLGGVYSTFMRPHLGSMAMAGLGTAVATSNAISMSNRGVDTKNTLGMGIGGALAVVGGKRLGVGNLANAAGRARMGRSISRVGKKFASAGTADDSKLINKLGNSMVKSGNSYKMSPAQAREHAFNQRAAKNSAAKSVNTSGLSPEQAKRRASAHAGLEERRRRATAGLPQEWEQSLPQASSPKVKKK